ncbi:MAG: InlB B-repeat-containing protein, partial [Candidatus Caccovivens sp.]
MKKMLLSFILIIFMLTGTCGILLLTDFPQSSNSSPVQDTPNPSEDVEKYGPITPPIIGGYTAYLYFNKNAGSDTVSNMPDTQSVSPLDPITNGEGTWYTSITIPDNIPTRTGYTFKCWNNLANGAGSNYNPGDSVPLSGSSSMISKTLYAQWTVNSYTLTFNTNGATSSSFPSSVTVTYTSGNYNDMSGASILRTGYTFLGWYTSSSGGTQIYGSNNICVTGTSYWDSNSNWCYAGNLTVYARWSAKIIKVTLDQQSGSGGFTEIYYKYQLTSPYYYYQDSSCSTPVYGTSGTSISTPGRTGYSFGGYYSSTGGSGTQYVNSSGTVINNLYSSYSSNVTLYAKWVANTYTVTANANGGTLLSTSESWNLASDGLTATKTVTYNSQYGTLPTATRSYYDFNGWWTATSGGTQITSTSTVSTASNHSLYAHWSIQTATVNIKFIKESKNGTTTESNAGGSTAISYTGTSNSTVNETLTGAKTLTVRVSSTITFTPTAVAGYVFTGVTESGTTLATNENKTFSVNKTNGATYNLYVHFKELSKNTLKYDSTEQYFYFEDGECPQDLVEDVALNIDSETESGVTISFDSTTHRMSLNGTMVSSIGLGATSYSNFKLGQTWVLSIKLVSGTVTGTASTFVLDVRKNGANVNPLNRAETSDTRLAGGTASLTISESGVTGDSFVLWIWYNNQNIVFNNAVYEVYLYNDLSKYFNNSVNSSDLTYEYDFALGNNFNLKVYTYSADGLKYAKFTTPTNWTESTVSIRGTSFTFKSNSSYWFKVQPIRWRITDYGVDKLPSNWSTV